MNEERVVEHIEPSEPWMRYGEFELYYKDIFPFYLGQEVESPITDHIQTVSFRGKGIVTCIDHVFTNGIIEVYLTVRHQFIKAE